ncbi:MAG TPA: response regulator, partial [Candidatus Omnitrophota bacterium]|nr:response regulator [Candidatus Omnitrophota bacterium]
MIPHASTRRTRVAVIDGNVGRRMEADRMLSPFYEVSLYGSGQQALDEMAAEPPAVVLVDELTPPMGGPAFLRALRRSPKLAPVPAVCVSSHGGQPAEAAAREAGADAFFVRPLKSGPLVTELARLSTRAVEAQWQSLPERQREALRRTVDTFNEISDLIDQGRPLDFAKVG